MTRALDWDGREVSWDEIKKLLVNACGGCPGEELREMIVAILRDWYGRACTIVVSLNGSPPHAVAIMRGLDFDPEKDDKVYIDFMKVLDAYLNVYRTVRGRFVVSLKELKQRKDSIITVSPKWLG